VMVARCIENGVFAVTTNRFGEDRRPDGTVRFTGRSQVVDPKGEILDRAPTQRTKLFITEIDPAKARNKMITPRNHLLKDRRPSLYVKT
jgi:predicted amidohydrolase